MLWLIWDCCGMPRRWDSLLGLAAARQTVLDSQLAEEEALDQGAATSTWLWFWAIPHAFTGGTPTPMPAITTPPDRAVLRCPCTHVPCSWCSYRSDADDCGLQSDGVPDSRMGFGSGVHGHPMPTHHMAYPMSPPMNSPIHMTTL